VSVDISPIYNTILTLRGRPCVAIVILEGSDLKLLLILPVLIATAARVCRSSQKSGVWATHHVLALHDQQAWHGQEYSPQGLAGKQDVILYATTV
jgi:hypothetical protein